jgi:hypothetical protein
MIPPGWKITRKALNPFKAIEIVAPNGWGAVVCEHEFNPGNVLYMLADTLLDAREDYQPDKWADKARELLDKTLSGREIEPGAEQRVSETECLLRAHLADRDNIVVTTDYSGAVVLVSRQNDEGQITEVLWEGKP